VRTEGWARLVEAGPPIADVLWVTLLRGTWAKVGRMALSRSDL
jgi:hypothetical protein